jgi:hypothetical protein
MSNFSKEIQNFQRYGTYEYKFDAVGNLTFDSSSADFSHVYLSIPLQNVVYNKNKLDSFYNSEFQEFVPVQTKVSLATTEETKQQVNLLTEENESLKTQLDSLTVQSNTDASGAEKLATKQVILELRKAVGQGRVDSDFSEDFPYSPIRKETI